MSLLRTLRGLACVLCATGAAQAPAVPFAYVANFTSNSVSVIDWPSVAVTTTIPVPGCGPVEVTVAPDGALIYVACASIGEVRVIDATTRSVVAAVPTASGTRQVAIHPSGAFGYAVRASAEDVVVFDTATNTITASISGFTFPLGVTFSPDGTAAYVADSSSSAVRVVDTATHAIVATIPVGTGPARTAFDPAGNRAYVTNVGTDTVSVIDTATRTVVATVSTGDSPRGLAFDAARARVLVANNSIFANSITVIDAATNAVAATIATGADTSPRAIGFAPDGRYLVVQQSGNAIAVYDSATDTLQSTVPVESQPAAIAIVPATPPSVAIDQAPAQPDPTGAATVDFTVVFSEAVTGFDAGDISFTGSSVAGTLAANVTGGPVTYNVRVSGMTSGGTVAASIPAGAAVDDLSSPSLASTSTDNTVTIDVAAPGVSIDQAAAQADPAAAAPVEFTVVFSEPVTGFDATDISFAGSTATGALVAVVTGSGTMYGVAVSGMTGNGTLVASIPAGSAADAAGNPNTASTSTDNAVTFAGFDVTPPRVTIEQAIGQADPATAAPFRFTVVFSEPVTGFDAADVSLAGSTAPGTLVAVVAGSGATYDVAVSGMTGSGTLVASIPAARAADASGNLNLASTSADNSVAFTFVRTSFTGPSATGSGTVTASFTGGGGACSFGTAQLIGAPPGAAPVPPVAPDGIAFPHGLFDFTTTGCAPGSTLAFTITYPSALPAGTMYWKYGPTASNPAPHWYVLAASFAGNVVTFSITDGGLGDDDLAANGTVVDQGGPGSGAAPGAVPVPTLGTWAMLLLSLTLLGAVAVRRGT